jgi:hypothetical protein
MQGVQVLRISVGKGVQLATEKTNFFSGLMPPDTFNNVLRKLQGSCNIMVVGNI